MVEAASSDRPLVSIGVPVFNEESRLSRALESLLAQRYDRIEIIVSDNASTDRTYSIAMQFADRDPRVTVVRNESNLGMVENFNRVFRLSHGEYFMWAAADDRWHPSFIDRCLEPLQEDPSVVLAYPRAVRMDGDGVVHEVMSGRQDTRGYDAVLRFMMTVWGNVNGNRIYGLIRSQALRKTRLFRNVFGADKVLLTELALLGPFAHVPEPLFYRPWVEGRESAVRRRRRFMAAMPIKSRWIVFPRLQTLFEYMVVAWHAPFPFARRVAACSSLLTGQAAIYGRHLFRPYLVPEGMVLAANGEDENERTEPGRQ